MAGIGDAAVRKATGRGWAEWLRALDALGARRLDHRTIARTLRARHPALSGWWCQMITVGYEQARGLREKYQQTSGFSVSASRTIAVPVARLFAAWADAGQRRAWLGTARLNVRKATARRSLRITWLADGTDVDVNVYARGARKSNVQVQHAKLPDARAVARQRNFWRARLDALQARLEGSHAD